MTAIRWIMRGLLAVMTVITGAVFFMVMTQPGQITSYVTDGRGLDAFFASLPQDAAEPTQTTRFKSVETEQAGRLSGIQARTRADIANQAAQAQTANSQWSNGQKPKAKVQGRTEAEPEFKLPTAERKTLRVGDY